MTSYAAATPVRARSNSTDIVRTGALAGTFAIAALVVVAVVFAPGAVTAAALLGAPAVVLALVARRFGPIDPSTARLVLGVPPALR